MFLLNFSLCFKIFIVRKNNSSKPICLILYVRISGKDTDICKQKISLGVLKYNACKGWRKQNWAQGEVAKEASADTKGCLEAGMTL